MNDEDQEAAVSRVVLESLLRMRRPARLLAVIGGLLSSASCVVGIFVGIGSFSLSLDVFPTIGILILTFDAAVCVRCCVHLHNFTLQISEFERTNAMTSLAASLSFLERFWKWAWLAMAIVLSWYVVAGSVNLIMRLGQWRGLARISHQMRPRPRLEPFSRSRMPSKRVAVGFAV